MAYQSPDQTPTRINSRIGRGVSRSPGSPRMFVLREERTPTKHSLNAMLAEREEVVSDDDEHGTDGDDEADDFAGSISHDMEDVDELMLSASQNASPPPRRRNPSSTIQIGDFPTPSEASHDDDYNDVDALSVGEESDFDPEAEEAFLKQSERDLIKEFKQVEKRVDSNRRESTVQWSMISSPDFAAVEPNIDFAKDPFLGLSPQDPTHRAMLDEAEDDLAAWRLPKPAVLSSSVEQDRGFRKGVTSGLNGDVATPANADRSKKTVRFRRASSVSSDEDAEEAFPDLMDSVTPGGSYSLNMFADPARPVDYESSDDSADEFSYQPGVAQNPQSESFSPDSESEEDSSDTDSDDGDTTDEDPADDEAEQSAYIQAAQAKIDSNLAAANLPSTPEPSKRPSRLALSRNSSDSTNPGAQPKTKVFAHDPSRAALFLGKDGVKLQSPSNPPEKDRAFWERARRAMGKTTATSGASVSWTRSESRAAKAPPKPFTCNQTLGNIFDGNLPAPGPIVGSTAPAVPGGLDAMMLDNWDETSSTEDHDFDDDEEDQIEELFNMSELVDFSGLCTTDGAQRPISAGAFSQHSQDFAISSPASRFPSEWDEHMAESEAERDGHALSHLSHQPNLVASFRINQDRARAAGSLAINPIRRAETSERNAIQSSRRGAENLPFSPARRKRISQDLTGAGVTKSPHTHRRGRGSSFAQNSAATAQLQKLVGGSGTASGRHI